MPQRSELPQFCAKLRQRAQHRAQRVENITFKKRSKIPNACDLRTIYILYVCNYDGMYIVFETELYSIN